MKKLFIMLIFSFILVGCSEEEKTAKDFGKGVSVEIQANETLKHFSLEKYVNGKLVSSDNVVHADNSPFEKGEIVYFDIPIPQKDEEVEFALAFSGKSEDTDSRSTDKLKIKTGNAWIELILTEQLQLKKVQ